MKKVLITGASGFIGSRLVQTLVSQGDVEVRALLHRPSSGVTISHLDVETVYGDICDPIFVKQCLQGIDMVVHLAYQNQPAKPGMKNATVEGTKVIANCSSVAGISHFVHISTLGVFSYNPPENVNENTPMRFSGDSYCDDKIKAERAVCSAWKTKPGFTILRLANVFGPFSGPWIVRLIDYLKNKRPFMVDDGQQTFSLLYVDNAVAGILYALRQERPKNQVYHLSDEISTVRNFVTEVAAWIPQSDIKSLSPSQYRQLFSWRKKNSIRREEMKQFLFGSESKKWLFRVLQFPLLMESIAWWLAHIPRSWRNALRRKIIGSGNRAAKRPSNEEKSALVKLDGRMFLDRSLYELLSSNLAFKHDKASRELGYTPVVPHREAMENTRKWCEWANLLDSEMDKF